MRTIAKVLAHQTFDPLHMPEAMRFLLGRYLHSQAPISSKEGDDFDVELRSLYLPSGPGLTWSSTLKGMARRAKIKRLTGFDRTPERVVGHPAQHQQVAVCRVCSAAWQQTMIVDSRRKIRAFFNLLDRYSGLEFDLAP